jgi:sugar phosphate isomerase/epimerase
MPLALADLGIQTYSFRGFRGKDIVDQVRRCGIRRVELCTMQVEIGDRAAEDRVLAEYREAGVAIDALGVHGCGSANDEQVFAFARRAGASVIGVDFAPTLSTATFRAAEQLAEKHDLKLAIHNHGGWHWLGSKAMLERVFAETGERIGLCLDTAWAMHASEDPLAMVRAFGSRLYGLHVKDFAFDAAGEHRDVVIGEGNLDLAALAAALDEVRFAGYAALEYEGEPEDPSPAIRACVAAAQQKLCSAATGAAAAGARHA